jgi:hypothetical protein
MGRISIPFQSLIDDYNNTLEKYGRGAGHLANEARKRWCDIRSQFPGWIERLPGSGFSTGFHDAICKDRNQRPSPTNDPPQESVRDTGNGQGYCAQNYTVTAQAILGESIREISQSGEGPIISIDFFVYGLDNRFITDHPPGTPYHRRRSMAYRFIFQNRTAEQEGIGGATNPPHDGGAWTYQISDDNCTDPDGPPPDTPPDTPPPPYWPKPTGEPYGGGPDLPPVPTPPPIPPLPSPPDFPDFPKPEININYNPDNRRFEGPDFYIDIGGPNININYNDRSPPPDLFPDPDVPKPVPRPPQGPGIDPFGGRPGFPELPWGEIIAEIIGEVVPDGGSWVDWLDIATDILDTLSELQPGEDGVAVEATNIPYYDCDSEEFKNLVWKVKQGDASAEDLNILSQAAQQAKLWCDEPHIVTGIPEWWARRQGANVPQLVVTFRRGDTSSYVSLQIPHYKNEPERGETPIGEYQAGDFMARETLIDNSKVVVNASDENEAERVLDQMCEWVQDSMRSSPPQRQFTRRQGQGISQLTRWPRKVEIFPQGRYSMAGPSKAWRLPIEGQQS